MSLDIGALCCGAMLLCVHTTEGSYPSLSVFMCLQLVADADDECENDCDSVVDAVDQEVDGSHDSHMTPGRKNLNATGTSRAQLSSGKKKKRKRKISLHQQYQKDGHPDKVGVTGYIQRHITLHQCHMIMFQGHIVNWVIMQL